MQRAGPSLVVATASFGALALCVVAAVSRDLRPWPPYGSATFAEWWPVLRNRGVVVEWNAPAAPSRLLLPVVSRGKAPLRVRLLRAAGQQELAAWTIDDRPHGDFLARLPVASRMPRPGRLRLELSSNADTEESAPRVGWSLQALAGTTVEVGAKVETGEGPLVVPEYRWRSLALLLLWAVVPLAARVDAAHGRRAAALPVVLGLAGLATSMLLWQRDYVRVLAHWDADEFGAYATRLATWLTVPGGRGAAAAWFAE